MEVWGSYNVFFHYQENFESKNTFFIFKTYGFERIRDDLFRNYEIIIM